MNITKTATKKTLQNSLCFTHEQRWPLCICAQPQHAAIPVCFCLLMFSLSHIMDVKLEFPQRFSSCPCSWMFELSQSHSSRNSSAPSCVRLKTFLFCVKTKLTSDECVQATAINATAYFCQRDWSEGMLVEPQQVTQEWVSWCTRSAHCCCWPLTLVDSDFTPASFVVLQLKSQVKFPWSWKLLFSPHMSCIISLSPIHQSSF